MTGIPLTRLETEETARLLHMELDIQKRVISQTEAIKRISEAVRRSRAGLKDPKSADRQLYFRRTYGRRQNAARQGPGRIHVRRRRRADPDRHVRVHGEA